MPTFTYILENEDATRTLGEDLALTVKPGDCLALRGDLGAGKSALSRALTKDENSFVREAAAASLGLIGSPEAIPALTRASTPATEPIADVRAAALRALAVIRTKKR